MGLFISLYLIRRAVMICTKNQLILTSFRFWPSIWFWLNFTLASLFVLNDLICCTFSFPFLSYKTKTVINFKCTYIGQSIPVSHLFRSLITLIFHFHPEKIDQRNDERLKNWNIPYNHLENAQKWLEFTLKWVSLWRKQSNEQVHTLTHTHI